MKIKTRFAMAAAFLAVAGTVAWSAGNWSTLPIVGSGSFCGSTVTGAGGLSGITGQGQATTGSICGETIPAGPPSLTDEELIPADTGLSGGAPPQTVVIPSGLLGGLNLKVNRLIGGDFGTNLWQRGTTPLSAASPAPALMSADRWWVYSSGNVATITKQTPAATAANYVPGSLSSMRVNRPSGTNTTSICVGQTLDKQAAAPLIGNNAVFSFYGYAPATYLQTNQTVVVTIAYFTASDAVATQAAIGDAGGNSSTFALGTTTGYAAAVAGASPGTTATVASGAATIALTTTPTRYSVYAPIPTVNASGTAVTALGVQICTGTYPASTGVAGDYFELALAQLQAMPSTATVNLPNGITSPTGFEKRNAAIEQLNQLYYSYVLIESATTVQSRTICHFTTGNSAMQCPITFPVPMRISPIGKFTTGFQGFTTTAETTANACTALALDATVTFVVSPAQAMVQCTIASGTTAAVGLSMTLWDLGTGSASGVMQFSAEP